MGAGEQQNIRVAVRVRPNNRREMEQNQRTIVKPIDSGTLLFDPDDDEDEFFYQGVKQTHRDITKRMRKKLSMEFDRVFDGEASNDDIYDDCMKPLIKSVMNGYNCSVFVYGATGAGKTFTMLGSSENPGITFLTMRELFREIEEQRSTYKFDIGISYLEVYNEQVMNLLTKSGPLRLREDANGVVVSGLVLKPIQSADELLNLLAIGNRNRTQHPTDANAESSRSHAVFQVHIRMFERKTEQKRMVKLSMIDLAGSERAASTKGIGARFKEGASINKSLLSLGNCINKLADGMKHIPYRDSNLTRILKDSLGGNCQTLMIANVSPSSLTYEDTYNTLKYASRAKKIRTTIKQSELRTNMPKEYYVKRVSEQQNEIEKLKAIVKELEEKLESNSSAQAKSYENSELKSWYRKIDVVCSSIMKSQEYFFSVQSKERLLKCRKKMLEYAEASKKILVLDGVKSKLDLDRMEASIERFGKQIVKQKDEKIRWRKRHFESLGDYKNLQTEINESKYTDDLTIYLKSKDNELQMSKTNIKMNHFGKILSIYLSEFERTYRALKISLEVIQRCYYILKATNNVSPSMMENFEKLIELCNHSQRRVFIPAPKTENEKANQSTDATHHDEFKLFCYLSDDNEERPKVAGGLKRISETESTEKNIFKSKKLYDNHEHERQTTVQEAAGTSSSKDENLGVFKLPSIIMCNAPPANHLNETHIVSEEANDIDTTFQISTSAANANKKGIQRQNDAEFIKNILTEQNVNAINKPLISNALLKSGVTKEKLLNRVHAGINMNKENNKKFSPNKISKSPKGASKTLAAKGRSAAAATLINQRMKIQTPTITSSASSNSTENSNHNAKLATNGVKTNRAALMRLKK